MYASSLSSRVRYSDLALWMQRTMVDTQSVPHRRMSARNYFTPPRSSSQPQTAVENGPADAFRLRLEPTSLPTGHYDIAPFVVHCSQPTYATRPHGSTSEEIVAAEARAHRPANQQTRRPSAMPRLSTTRTRSGGSRTLKRARRRRFRSVSSESARLS